ncbi:hypothetical protein AMECASPLE_036931 [Ameca splendens]|uniref:Uncharacterized protein n=1 Tax=Ameca splendens TaxID=208324 RepID=A0ABV0Z7E1_9TELE
MRVDALLYTRFLHKICNSECEDPQTCPMVPGQTLRRSKPHTSKGPPKSQEPHENHRRNYRNPPKEEQWRVPGEPPSNDSAEAPGSRSDEPTGPAGSRPRVSRSSHGPRGPRPQADSAGTAQTRVTPARLPPPRPEPSPQQPPPPVERELCTKEGSTWLKQTHQPEPPQDGAVPTPQ